MQYTALGIEPIFYKNNFIKILNHYIIHLKPTYVSYTKTEEKCL